MANVSLILQCLVIILGCAGRAYALKRIDSAVKVSTAPREVGT